MPTEETKTELTEEQKVKKSQVQAFIKELEKHESDPEYRHMMENLRRVQADFKEFMAMPKEQRSKIMFGIQVQLIRREVDMNPDSPYNWQRRDLEERSAELKAKAKAQAEAAALAATQSTESVKLG